MIHWEWCKIPRFPDNQTHPSPFRLFWNPLQDVFENPCQKSKAVSKTVYTGDLSFNFPFNLHLLPSITYLFQYNCIAGYRKLKSDINRPFLFHMTWGSHDYSTILWAMHSLCQIMYTVLWSKKARTRDIFGLFWGGKARDTSPQY